MPTLTPINQLPEPLGNEGVNRANYNALIDAIEAAIRSLAPMTTAQRDALPAARLWLGRLIWNTTTGQYERCTAVGPPSTWTADTNPIYALDTDVSAEATTRAAADTAEIAARIAADAAHSGGIDGATKHVQQLAAGKTNANGPATYPTGLSSADVLAADGFPIDGVLFTIRHGANRTEQMLRSYALAAGNPRQFNRYGLSDDSGWGNWSELATLGATGDPFPQYALDTDLTTHAGLIDTTGIDHITRIAAGKLNADLPSTYPLGVSFTEVATADGFPVAGALLTVVRANYVVQWLQQSAANAGATEPETYRRTGGLTSNTWSSAGWRQMWTAGNHGSTGDPHTQYVLDTEKAAASGVATLDANSRVVQDAIHFTALAQALASTLVGRTQVTGDTNDRWELQADGSMLWGPGSAGVDTQVKRGGAAQVNIRNGADSADGTIKLSKVLFSSTNAVELSSNSAYFLRFASAGSPEGAITASPGALYLRNDGAAGTTLYVKETGSSTNTGWSAVPSLIGANLFTAKQRAPIWTDLAQTPAFSATPTWNLNSGDVIAVTLTGNITAITFSNVPATGELASVLLYLTQDATGGRSVTWPAAVKWVTGSAPTLSAASKLDIISLFTRDGGTTWYGVVVGQNL